MKFFRSIFNTLYSFLFITFCILLIVYITSCKKDVKSLQLDVSPSYTNVLTANVGDIVPFQINISSGADLRKFTITASSTVTYTVTLLDTNISGTSFSFKYLFTVPAKYSDQEALLTFSIWDANGNTASQASKIRVGKYHVYLTETTGHIVYSRFSSNFCAYDLIDGIGKYYAQDITMQDIRDSIIAADTVNHALGRKWISPTKCQFVVNDGFDYANADTTTAGSAFRAGTKAPEVNNIHTGNIIITRIKRNNLIKYAVIKVTAINDSINMKKNYYQFNLKK